MKKIIFQGDSITDSNRFNTINQMGDGYVSMLNDRLTDFTVVNHGISGNRLPEIMSRIQETIDVKPDIVFILVGINEIWHHYKHGKEMTPIQFRKNYEWLLEKIKSELPQTKICLIEPFVFPIGQYEDSWMSDLLTEQQMVYELSFKYHTGFIPLQKIMDEGLLEYKMIDILPDGVHPSRLGHGMIANSIVEYLSLVLDKNFEVSLKQ